MLASARGVLRYRQTPRANTVRPYVPLPIGPVGRGLTPPRHLAFIAIFLFICKGGVPDAPCNFALLQNLWFTVGADSISARAALRNHAIARRGQDPSLRTDHKRVTTLRGVEDAAPLRPTCKLASTRCGPMQASAPTE